MSDTKVVNLRKESFDVYIGRSGKGQTSIFGNPYSIGKDGTREEVLKKFKIYLWKRMQEDEDFCRQLLELDGKVLGCFCKPQACHGDILVAAINYLKGQCNE